MGGHVPLGYVADGRTLKVEEVEADAIRTLYDLYVQHGSVREVKDHAEALDLSATYLIKTRFSAVWSEQRAQFNTL